MLSIETRILIDKICDQAETQWKAGVDPRIAKMVTLVDASAVPVLITELIRVDREINERKEDELKQFYLTALPSVYGDLVVNAILANKDPYADSLSIPEAIAPENFDPNDYIGTSIGNYRIEKVLGVGGFGMVYRARDKILNRHVVIKIPRAQIFGDDKRVDDFLVEAKNIAQLRHSNILRVLHVGKDQGQPYIVEEYFEDGDLGRMLDQSIPEQDYTKKFVKQLADAISHAHRNGIIHRDLKPANILIGIHGEPIVGDFGLSLHAAKISSTSRHIAGTVQYMSPEQIRGETHRLDGRTDIWSIGVVLYRMLTGRLPFDGRTSERVAKKIIFGCPQQPRELFGTISEELNRICMRCLSQRVNDRYETAAELSEDLSRLIKFGGETSDSRRVTPIRVKGLASFGNEDRDFFLSLLPGPISRNGYPECIDFWKKRIERRDMSQPVGLILGASGSGKSSMVRAGLVPSLNDEIEVVVVNATVADTEVRLLKGLRAKFPELPNDVSLPVAIAGLRERRWLKNDRRLLIVLDQFEQWLHVNSADEHPQLVHALRHCDGDTVMALVLVREDFFMAVSRFFKRLEIDLVARKNFASVELFDESHARKLLVKFGQSLGKLSGRKSDFSQEQNQFLDRAIELISDDQAVMCVKLAIFIEAVKKLPWTIDSLLRIGNSQEIGTYFLEQALGNSCKNPRHSVYRSQLIKTLEELLPSPGVEIKGAMCSTQQLAEATGMRASSSDFKTILRILDSELRLITPAEPDGEFEESSEHRKSFFQLTHDYLVPSLREWLRRVRGQSRQGRAKLRLQELAGSWDATSDSRFMPGFFEYAAVVWHVPDVKRTQSEQRFMNQAGRFFGIRFLILSLVCLVVSGLIWRSSQINRHHLTRNRVDQFVSGQPAALESIVGLLKTDRATAIDCLEHRLAQNDLREIEKRRLNLGLGMLGEYSRSRTEYLVSQIPFALDTECAVFNVAFKKDPEAIEVLDSSIAENSDLSAWAREVIVRGFLDPDRLPPAFECSVIPDARSTLIHEFAKWHGDLDQCYELFSVCDEPDYLAGLCLGLSGIRPDEIGVDEFKLLCSKILSLYEDHPSSLVHASARTVLTDWELELPKLDNKNNEHHEWWVNEFGMTMVEYWAIDENGMPSTLSISSCEITEALFAEFLNDEKYPDDRKPKYNFAIAASQKPVVGLRLDDAVRFCYWLSARLGLQECYSSNGVIKYTDYNDVEYEETKWELVAGANGYRLPTCLEWELAARGGTQTMYPHSNHEFFDGRGSYQWHRDNSKHTYQPIGQLMPNQFGIFDMLGNASEICWGVDAIDTPRSYETLYSCRGGSAISNILLQTVKSVGRPRLDKRRVGVGFRVVANRKR